MRYRLESSALVAFLSVAVSASAAAGEKALQPAPAAVTPPSCIAPGIQPPAAANSHAATAEDYPPLSAALSEQGRVMLEMTVKADGSVGDIKILRSSGFPRLDEAAVSEIAPRWKYTPAMRDGKPIECRWVAAVNWSLQAGAPGAMPNNPPLTVMQMGPDQYTDDMRSRHEQGAAVVFGLLQEDGRIRFASVVQSSGYPDIDAASLKIVQSGWQFKAAEAAGRPIKTIVAIGFVWSLTPSAAAGPAPVQVPSTDSPPSLSTVPK